MKPLKALGATAILALALSVPTYAGEMLSPGVTPPPPPPPPEEIITVDTATATSSLLGDPSITSVEGILWVFGSIL